MTRTNIFTELLWLIFTSILPFPLTFSLCDHRVPPESDKRSRCFSLSCVMGGWPISPTLNSDHPLWVTVIISCKTDSRRLIIVAMVVVMMTMMIMMMMMLTVGTSEGFIWNAYIHILWWSWTRTKTNEKKMVHDVKCFNEDYEKLIVL